jgi:hypothetical protein
MASKKFKLLALSSDKLSLSNYVNLPVSILSEIKDIDPPYYFKITSEVGLRTWVGVQDFTSDESFISLPTWIMDNIGISGSDIIKIELEQYIPKGKYVKFQPQEKEFFDIPECEGCLEQILSNFCILHQNQNIQLNIIGKIYNIKVLHVDIDWEKVNFENNENILSDNVIDIKNIDLCVDIDNKFYVEEPKQVKPINVPKQLLKKSIPVKKELPKMKGLTISNKTNPSKDEARKARLEYFTKKFNLDKLDI